MMAMLEAQNNLLKNLAAVVDPKLRFGKMLTVWGEQRGHRLKAS